MFRHVYEHKLQEAIAKIEVEEWFTVTQLMEKIGCSRSTAHRFLRRPSDQWVLESHHGIGFVKRAKAKV